MATIGQLLMFGVTGTKVTPELKHFLRETGVGGVILFARNYRSPQQVADFIHDLQQAAGEPLIIGVDQEGGRVARFAEPFTKLPPMAALGSAGAEGAALARSVGGLLGRELAAVGVTIDFAPVLDVNTHPANPVIGDRAMAGDAAAVAALGAAFIEGLQGEGVAACGKHFPGHGDTDVDSHVGLPVLPHTRRRFELCELVPFRAAIAADVAAMMTAHLLIPCYDRELPASVSRAITTGLLRHELCFDRLVFTDDVLMQGIADRFPPTEWGWRGIAAGADIVPVCHDRDKQLAALEGLKRAAGEGMLDVHLAGAALARIAAFKKRFCAPGRARPSLGVIGCGDHRAVAQRLWSVIRA
jgi:beta-N-acetylhexosaminidase